MVYVFCKLCLQSLPAYHWKAHTSQKSHLQQLPLKILAKGPFDKTQADALYKYFSKFGNIRGHSISPESDTFSVEYRFWDARFYSEIIHKNHVVAGQNVEINWFKKTEKGALEWIQPDDKMVREKYIYCKLDLIEPLSGIKEFPDQLRHLNGSFSLIKEKFETNRKKIEEDLRLSLGVDFPQSMIHFFGSTITELYLDDSNYNIYIDNTDSSVVTLEKIKRLLENSEKFKNISTKDTTLIITCTHIELDIACQIDIKNELPIGTSELIKFYLTINENLRTLMLIIKLWADCYGLKSQENFSGYTLCLMVIFYLQQKPYKLPSVLDLQQDLPRDEIDTWNCTFGPVELKRDLEKAQLSDMLIGFFKFYSEFDYGTQMISPFFGSGVDKSRFLRPYDLPTAYQDYINNNKELTLNDGFSVQDVFEHSTNLTENISLTACGKFVSLCRNSLRLLNEELNLYKLFLCIEERVVCDMAVNSKEDFLNFLTNSLKEVLFCDIELKGMDDLTIVCRGEIKVWQNRINFLKFVQAYEDSLDREIKITQEIVKEGTKTDCWKMLIFLTWETDKVHLEFQEESNLSVCSHLAHLTYQLLLRKFAPQATIEPSDFDIIIIDDQEDSDIEIISQTDDQENPYQFDSEWERDHKWLVDCKVEEKDQFGLVKTEEQKNFEVKDEKNVESSVKNERQSTEEEDDVQIVENNEVNIIETRPDLLETGFEVKAEMQLTDKDNNMMVVEENNESSIIKMNLASTPEENEFGHVKTEEALGNQDLRVKDHSHNINEDNVCLRAEDQSQSFDEGDEMQLVIEDTSAEQAPQVAESIPENENKISDISEKRVDLKDKPQNKHLQIKENQNHEAGNKILKSTEKKTVQVPKKQQTSKNNEISLNSVLVELRNKHLQNEKLERPVLNSVNDQNLLTKNLTIDAKVEILFSIIRLWIDSKELSAYFTDYPIFLMIIFSLQQEPYNLPSINNPENTIKLQQSSILDLLSTFFQFYGHCDYIANVLSPHHGILKAKNREEKLHSGFYLQDPLGEPKNLTTDIPLKICGKFTNLCRNSDSFLKREKSPDLTKLLTSKDEMFFQMDENPNIASRFIKILLGVFGTRIIKTDKFPKLVFLCKGFFDMCNNGAQDFNPAAYRIEIDSSAKVTYFGPELFLHHFHYLCISELCEHELILGLRNNRIFPKQMEFLKAGHRYSDIDNMIKIKETLQKILSKSLPQIQISFYEYKVRGLPQNCFNLNFNDVMPKSAIQTIHDSLIDSKQFKDCSITNSTINCTYKETQLVLYLKQRHFTKLEEILQFYSSIDENIQTLMLFVISWVQHLNLTEFSPHALHLMVIFYLQQKPYQIMSVHKIMKTHKTPQFKNYPISILIRGFFKFYANFDYISYLITPYCGSIQEKMRFLKNQDAPKYYEDYVAQSKEIELHSGICVQNPAELWTNLSKEVTLSQSGRFTSFCRLALNVVELNRYNFLDNIFNVHLNSIHGLSIINDGHDEESFLSRTESAIELILKDFLAFSIDKKQIEPNRVTYFCKQSHDIWSKRIKVLKCFSKSMISVRVTTKDSIISGQIIKNESPLSVVRSGKITLVPMGFNEILVLIQGFEDEPQINHLIHTRAKRLLAPQSHKDQTTKINQTVHNLNGMISNKNSSEPSSIELLSRLLNVCTNFQTNRNNSLVQIQWDLRFLLNKEAKLIGSSSFGLELDTSDVNFFTECDLKIIEEKLKPKFTITNDVFIHTKTQKACTFSCAFLTKESSEVIQFYVNLNPKIKSLLLFVKNFMIKHSVLSKKLSSYAIYLMVLFYLQQEHHVPSFIELRNQSGQNRWETEKPVEISTAILELIKGFFRFYEVFDYFDDAICPVVSQRVKRMDLIPPYNLPDGCPKPRRSTSCGQDFYIMSLRRNSNLVPKNVEQDFWEFPMICRQVFNILNTNDVSTISKLNEINGVAQFCIQNTFGISVEQWREKVDCIVQRILSDILKLNVARRAIASIRMYYCVTTSNILDNRLAFLKTLPSGLNEFEQDLVAAKNPACSPCKTHKKFSVELKFEPGIDMVQVRLRGENSLGKYCHFIYTRLLKFLSMKDIPVIAPKRPLEQDNGGAKRRKIDNTVSGPFPTLSEKGTSSKNGNLQTGSKLNCPLEHGKENSLESKVTTSKKLNFPEKSSVKTVSRTNAVNSKQSGQKFSSKVETTHLNPEGKTGDMPTENPAILTKSSSVSQNQTETSPRLKKGFKIPLIKKRSISTDGPTDTTEPNSEKKKSASRENVDKKDYKQENNVMGTIPVPVVSALTNSNTDNQNKSQVVPPETLVSSELSTKQNLSTMQQKNQSVQESLKCGENKDSLLVHQEKCIGVETHSNPEGKTGEMPENPAILTKSGTVSQNQTETSPRLKKGFKIPLIKKRSVSSDGPTDTTEPNSEKKKFASRENVDKKDYKQENNVMGTIPVPVVSALTNSSIDNQNKSQVVPPETLVSSELSTKQNLSTMKQKNQSVQESLKCVENKGSLLVHQEECIGVEATETSGTSTSQVKPIPQEKKEVPSSTSLSPVATKAARISIMDLNYKKAECIILTSAKDLDFLKQIKFFTSKSIKPKNQIDLIKKSISNDLLKLLPSDLHKFEFSGAVVTGLFLTESTIDICFPNEGDPVAILTLIQSKLVENEKFSNIQLNPSRKFLTFLYSGMQQCEIYIDNILPVKKTDLVAYFLSFDAKLRDFFFLIQKWADGILSKYPIHLLIIFFLQQQPFNFPTVSSLQRNLKPEIVENCNIAFEKVPFTCPKLSNMDLTELLQLFFDFYSKFDFFTNVIAPFCGEAIPKMHFKRTDLLHSNYAKNKITLSITDFLCIQDPFDHSINVTLKVDESDGAHFISMCRSALAVLKSSRKSRLYRLMTQCHGILDEYQSFRFRKPDGQKSVEFFRTVKILVPKILVDILGATIVSSSNNGKNFFYQFKNVHSVWENRIDAISKLGSYQSGFLLETEILKIVKQDPKNCSSFEINLEVRLNQDPPFADFLFPTGHSLLLHFFYTRLMLLFASGQAEIEHENKDNQKSIDKIVPNTQKPAQEMVAKPEDKVVLESVDQVPTASNKVVPKFVNGAAQKVFQESIDKLNKKIAAKKLTKKIVPKAVDKVTPKSGNEVLQNVAKDLNDKLKAQSSAEKPIDLTTPENFFMEPLTILVKGNFPRDKIMEIHEYFEKLGKIVLKRVIYEQNGCAIEFVFDNHEEYLKIIQEEHFVGDYKLKLYPIAALKKKLENCKFQDSRLAIIEELFMSPCTNGPFLMNKVFNIQMSSFENQLRKTKPIETQNLILADLCSTLSGRFNIQVFLSDLRLHYDHLNIEISTQPFNITLDTIKALICMKSAFTNVVIRNEMVLCKHVKTKKNCWIRQRTEVVIARNCLVKYYLKLSTKVRQLMVFIQFWAYCHFAENENFSTDIIQILVIFFLQQKPYKLPSVVDLKQNSQNSFEKWDCTFTENNNFKSEMLDLTTIFGLVMGFFEFYSKFDYISNVIAPYCGEIMKKLDFLKSCSLSMKTYKLYISNGESLEMNCGFVVQDFFEHSHNVAQNINLDTCGKFTALCRLSLDLIQKNVTSPLYHIFLQTQIEDPSFVLKKLPKMTPSEWTNKISKIKNIIHKILTNILQYSVSQIPNFNSDGMSFGCVGKQDVWYNRIETMNKISDTEGFVNEVQVSRSIEAVTADPWYVFVELHILKAPEKVKVCFVRKRGFFDLFHVCHFLFIRLTEYLDSPEADLQVPPLVLPKPKIKISPPKEEDFYCVLIPPEPIPKIDLTQDDGPIEKQSKKNEEEENDDVPLDFFDDFSDEEFLKGLDISDDEAKEKTDSLPEKKSRSQERKRKARSPERSSTEKKKDRSGTSPDERKKCTSPRNRRRKSTFSEEQPKRSRSLIEKKRKYMSPEKKPVDDRMRRSPETKKRKSFLEEITEKLNAISSTQYHSTTSTRPPETQVYVPQTNYVYPNYYAGSAYFPSHYAVFPQLMGTPLVPLVPHPAPEQLISIVSSTASVVPQLQTTTNTTHLLNIHGTTSTSELFRPNPPNQGPR